MRFVLYLSAAVLTMTFLPGGSRADDEREGKTRFKGVELYSWQDKEKHWIFVLLDGTNEEKTEAQVKGAKDQIKGTADLKKALSRLAIEEYVSWSHRITGFEFPSEDTRKEIEKSAEEAKIHLTISTR